MNWRTKVLAAALITVLGASILYGGFYVAVSLAGRTETGTVKGPELLNMDDNRSGQEGPGNGSTGLDGNDSAKETIEDDMSGQAPPGSNELSNEDDARTYGQGDMANGSLEGQDRQNEGFLRDVGLIMAGAVLLVLISLMVFSFSRIRSEELLKQERRLSIYRYIIDHPGDHFRAIQRALGLQVGVLSHHMNVLEKEQLIVSEQDGNNRRFYAAGVKRNNGEVRLSRIQENILRTIQTTPGITQSQIAKDLGVNRKVVFYNVKFLSGSGIVTEQKIKRRAHYYPNDMG